MAEEDAPTPSQNVGGSVHSKRYRNSEVEEETELAFSPPFHRSRLENKGSPTAIRIRRSVRTTPTLGVSESRTNAELLASTPPKDTSQAPERRGGGYGDDYDEGRTSDENDDEAALPDSSACDTSSPLLPASAPATPPPGIGLAAYIHRFRTADPTPPHERKALEGSGGDAGFWWKGGGGGSSGGEGGGAGFRGAGGSATGSASSSEQPQRQPSSLAALRERLHGAQRGQASGPRTPSAQHVEPQPPTEHPQRLPRSNGRLRRERDKYYDGVDDDDDNEDEEEEHETHVLFESRDSDVEGQYYGAEEDEGYEYSEERHREAEEDGDDDDDDDDGDLLSVSSSADLASPLAQGSCGGRGAVGGRGRRGGHGDTGLSQSMELDVRASVLLRHVDALLSSDQKERPEEGRPHLSGLASPPRHVTPPPPLTPSSSSSDPVSFAFSPLLPANHSTEPRQTPDGRPHNSYQHDQQRQQQYPHHFQTSVRARIESVRHGVEAIDLDGRGRAEMSSGMGTGGDGPSLLPVVSMFGGTFMGNSTQSGRSSSAPPLIFANPPALPTPPLLRRCGGDSEMLSERGARSLVAGDTACASGAPPSGVAFGHLDGHGVPTTPPPLNPPGATTTSPPPSQPPPEATTTTTTLTEFEVVCSILEHSVLDLLWSPSSLLNGFGDEVFAGGEGDYDAADALASLSMFASHSLLGAPAAAARAPPMSTLKRDRSLGSLGSPLHSSDSGSGGGGEVGSCGGDRGLSDSQAPPTKLAGGGVAGSMVTSSGESRPGDDDGDEDEVILSLEGVCRIEGGGGGCSGGEGNAEKFGEEERSGGSGQCNKRGGGGLLLSERFDGMNSQRSSPPPLPSPPLPIFVEASVAEGGAQSSHSAADPRSDLGGNSATVSFAPSSASSSSPFSSSTFSSLSLSSSSSSSSSSTLVPPASDSSSRLPVPSSPLTSPSFAPVAMPPRFLPSSAASSSATRRLSSSPFSGRRVREEESVNHDNGLTGGLGSVAFSSQAEQGSSSGSKSRNSRGRGERRSAEECDPSQGGDAGFGSGDTPLPSPPKNQKKYNGDEDSSNEKHDTRMSPHSPLSPPPLLKQQQQQQQHAYSSPQPHRDQIHPNLEQQQQQQQKSSPESVSPGAASVSLLSGNVSSMTIDPSAPSLSPSSSSSLSPTSPSTPETTTTTAALSALGFSHDNGFGGQLSPAAATAAATAVSAAAAMHNRATRDDNLPALADDQFSDSTFSNLDLGGGGGGESDRIDGMSFGDEGLRPGEIAGEDPALAALRLRELALTKELERRASSKAAAAAEIG